MLFKGRPLNREPIVYVTGLSRVGSTLLDLVLGCHTQIIGLGEVYEIIRPDWDRLNSDFICTCGKAREDCIVWGTVSKELKRMANDSEESRYRLVLDVFYDVFGDQAILVDSSKLLSGLKVLQKVSGAQNVKIIAMTRDVRAWTISRLDHRSRYSDSYKINGFYVQNLQKNYGPLVTPFKWMIPFLSQRASYYFLLWYYQNKQYNTFLAQQKSDIFRLGYEEFALSPEVTLPLLCRFLGVDLEEKMFTPLHSKSHILSGNPMKSDKSRNRRIQYDHRWFKRNEWIFSAFLFKNIMSYNSATVYSNTSNSVFEKIDNLPDSSRFT